MYAFPSPSPREVLKEGRPTGWVGCRERSTFSLMYYLGRYQQLLPLLCSGATSGPGPLFLRSWSLLRPLPPQPCCEVAPQGKQDPCRLSVWTGGSELLCISHCQRPGLLLMCCWSKSQQRLPPPHPGSALGSGCLCVPQLSFLSSPRAVLFQLWWRMATPWDCRNHHYFCLCGKNLKTLLISTNFHNQLFPSPWNKMKSSNTY